MAGCRALIVDDDETTRKEEREFLKVYGLETKAVNNVEEALDKIRVRESFHLVLMDLQMPVKDGVEAFYAIRNSVGVSCVIVGVTRHYEEVKNEFLSAGLDLCFMKPLRPGDYIDIVNKLTD